MRKRGSVIQRCKYCNAPIVFLRTQKNRWMVVEPTPKVVEEAEKYAVAPIYEDLRDAFGEELVVPHWAKCSGADQARGRGKR